jgi:hypothetical protein
MSNRESRSAHQSIGERLLTIVRLRPFVLPSDRIISPLGLDTVRPAPPARSSHVVVAGLIAAVAPLALLLSNTDWFFTREGYLDPWNYVGLFREYLDPDYLPEDYKLARLPWILSGYVVHSVLSPVTAAYALHAVFLCAATLALFVGIEALFHKPALAAVLALCLGFYTPVHGSGGWDYHNTAAGAFYLATFALLALPSALAGNRLVLAGAGAMGALALHTNITLVNLLPALVLVYLSAVRIFLTERVTARTLVARIGWGVLGAIVATVALGVVNWHIGREFLFFAPLLRVVARYVGNPDNQAAFHQSWSSGWFWTARYLALPAAVFVAGCTFFAVGRRLALGSADRLAASLVLQFLLVALLWGAWQTAGQTALDVDYFAYVLIPNCFIALAGILSRVWPDWCERHWLVTTVGVAVLLGACLAVEDVPGVAETAAFIAPFSFVAMLALLLAALIAVLLRPSVTSLAIVFVVFAFSNRLVVAGSSDYLASDPCKVQSDVYRGVVDAASWLVRTDPLYRRVRTWFDERELIQPISDCNVRLGFMGNSITTMTSMGYVTRPFPMPAVEDVPDAAVRALTEGDRLLAIISSRPEHLQAWTRRLETLGLVHEEVARHSVAVGASGFTVHAWTIRAVAQ